MSMELMDEHEQGEHVRTWLRENGASIIGGIAIGIAGIMGWKWWQGSQITQQVEAAAQYASLVDAAGRDDRDGAEAIAKSLQSGFKDSGYSAMAAFTLADLQLKAGETQAAADTLRAALAATEDAALKSLVRTRLARVLIAAGQAEAALESLPAAADEGAMAAELRGDALQALGRSQDAIAEYRKAYDAYDDGLPNRRLVEMKLLDLGIKMDNADA